MTKQELVKEMKRRLVECEKGLKESPGNSAVLVRKLEVEAVTLLVQKLNRIHSVTYDEILVDLFNRVVAPGQRVNFMLPRKTAVFEGEVARPAYLGDDTHALVKLKGLDESVPVAFIFNIPGWSISSVPVGKMADQETMGTGLNLDTPEHIMREQKKHGGVS